MTTVVFLVFVPVLVGILLVINPILQLTPVQHSTKEEDLVDAYECGYTTVPGQTRSPLSIAFYIVAILYLVFDLEIALLIPIVSGLELVGGTGFTFVLIFIIMLTAGFVYELSTGAINWSKMDS